MPEIRHGDLGMLCLPLLGGLTRNVHGFRHHPRNVPPGSEAKHRRKGKGEKNKKKKRKEKKEKKLLKLEILF